MTTFITTIVMIIIIVIIIVISEILIIMITTLMICACIIPPFNEGFRADIDWASTVEWKHIVPKSNIACMLSCQYKNWVVILPCNRKIKT